MTPTQKTFITFEFLSQKNQGWENKNNFPPFYNWKILGIFTGVNSILL